MTKPAKPGTRVRDSQGYDGVITSVLGHIVEVLWDDGTVSQHPASYLHRPGNRTKWLLRLAVTLAFGLGLALAVWL